MTQDTKDRQEPDFKRWIGRITLANFGSSQASGGLVTVPVKSEAPEISMGVSEINLVGLADQMTQPVGRSVAFEALLDRVSIKQNYPNPFNPKTVNSVRITRTGGGARFDLQPCGSGNRRSG